MREVALREVIKSLRRESLLGSVYVPVVCDYMHECVTVCVCCMC